MKPQTNRYWFTENPDLEMFETCIAGQHNHNYNETI